MKKVLFIMFALMTTTWAYVNSQMDLFTEDAEVHSKAGEHVSVMKSKEQIGKWLIKRRESNFLFTTVEDVK